MEDAQKDSSSPSATAGGSGSKLLRYPLRSAVKPKEEKPPLADASNYSASASRGKRSSNVNKSVSVLDPSGKEKSAKPSRRLSVPSKSSISPSPKPVGNGTPNSQANKARKSLGSQSKSDPRISDVSIKRKFTVLSSASYWQSQIKVSEAAAKHFISLGFFKLALEAGCEPVQLLRDELKSYVRRHDLNQYGESVKQLFESYNITEEYEQLQVSETCSHVPESEIRSSDDDVNSSRSVKSKPQNLGATTKSSQGKDAKKETSQKNESMTKLRRSLKMDSANSKTGLKSGGGSITQKTTQKPKTQKSNEDHGTLEKQGKDSANEKGVNESSSVEHVEHQEEHLDATAKTEDAVQTEDVKMEV